jgi:hypothetical protein
MSWRSNVWPAAASRCARTTPAVLRLSGNGSTRLTRSAVRIAELRESLAELEMEILQAVEEAAYRSG